MNDLWYALPLVVTVSFVYGATRHEETAVILEYTWKTAVWLLSFMAILGAIVCTIDWLL
jgi:hypothetical protein